jgi:endonuclease YncB( thermonuclease family)
MTPTQEAEDAAVFAPHGKNATKPFSLAGRDTLARVVSVHDGDTLTAVLPFAGGFHRFAVRLEGIDACEVTSKAPANKRLAALARARLCALISGCIGCIGCIRDADFERRVHLVRLECGGFDKYGRILASVFHPYSQDARSFNQTLVLERLAYVYGGKKKLTEAEQVSLLAEDGAAAPSLGC